MYFLKNYHIIYHSVNCYPYNSNNDSFEEHTLFKHKITLVFNEQYCISVKILSLPNQDEIKNFLNKHTVLYLSSSINGLPSVTCLPFRTLNNNSGNPVIYLALSKESIEYNQLAFNRNCSLFVGSKEEGLKIFGKAKPVEFDQVKDLFADTNDFSAYVEIIPEQIDFEIGETKLQLMTGQPERTISLMKGNISSELKFWFRITRAPFFTATLMPILLGVVLAWVLTDNFSLLLMILTLVAGILIHSGTNLINDYFDQRTDQINDNFTPFSGGSRTIQLRLASQEKILMSAIVSFILGIGIVVMIDYYIQSIELLILMILGIFLAYFYTAGPLRLSHHGLGEISNFLGYGPILTLSAWVIQTKGAYSIQNILTVMYWSFIPGLMLMLILLINEFQDFDSDKAAGKKTLIVRIGKSKGRLVYNTVGIATFVLIGLGVLFNYQRAVFTVIALLGLILLFKTAKIIKNNLDKIQELLPANGLTVQNHLVTNLLLLVGFIITKLVIS